MKHLSLAAVARAPADGHPLLMAGPANAAQTFAREYAEQAKTWKATTEAAGIKRT